MCSSCRDAGIWWWTGLLILSIFFHVIDWKYNWSQGNMVCDLKVCLSGALPPPPSLPAVPWLPAQTSLNCRQLGGNQDMPCKYFLCLSPLCYLSLHFSLFNSAGSYLFNTTLGAHLFFSQNSPRRAVLVGGLPVLQKQLTLFFAFWSELSDPINTFMFVALIRPS